MTAVDPRPLLAFVAALLLLSPPCPSLAADPRSGETEAGVELITHETQKAIDRGLQFLARQQHDDGSFGSGGYSRNVAVCGLAGMAFMSAGSVAERGPYAPQVARCLQFILANCQDDGFIDVPGSS